MLKPQATKTRTDPTKAFIIKIIRETTKEGKCPLLQILNIDKVIMDKTNGEIHATVGCKVVINTTKGGPIINIRVKTIMEKEDMNILDQEIYMPTYAGLIKPMEKETLKIVKKAANITFRKYAIFIIDMDIRRIPQNVAAGVV